MKNEKLIWEIRAYIYHHFTETTHAPSVRQTAAHFALTVHQAELAYIELNNRHAFFLSPGTRDILIANPFSNIETPFLVDANGKTYFANCAWDSLGIPAALHCDADVEAACSQSGEPLSLQVRDGHVSESDVLVHFLVPFKNWYDDLVFT